MSKSAKQAQSGLAVWLLSSVGYIAVGVYFDLKAGKPLDLHRSLISAAAAAGFATIVAVTTLLYKRLK